MTHPEYDERIAAVELAIESIRRYMEEDRRITASVDRLGTGVGELNVVMNRLDDQTRAITRVERKAEEQTRAVTEDTAQQRKRVLREVRVFAAVAALFAMMLVGGFLLDRAQDEARRADSLRVSHDACEAGNARVDHIERLLLDLTAGARPEAQARIDKALQPFRATKRNCDALYPVS